MKKPWIFDERPSNESPDHFWVLTRADLEEPELVIYDSTLARLVNPSPEQLRMLAAYAWAASELKKAAESDDQALTLWLRDCMVYARNGLGISPVRFIDGFALLLDWKETWPAVYLSMSVSWQLH
jgi:hypothetical protein